jgi:osmotically-inducible protein OsmY
MQSYLDSAVHVTIGGSTMIMKSDSQIQRDVMEELRWDPQTSKCEIGVAVKDGVVTLSGTVDAYARKVAAESAAQRVSGVRALAEDLAVKLDGLGERTDTEIAHAAVNALHWDSRVPEEKVSVKVENGWIVLTGSVPFKFQSDAATRAVRYLTGVKGITNSIRLSYPSASPSDVKSRIESALRRNAELEARQLTVDASAGKVTLKGRVHSWNERRAAEQAAWAAPGVAQVDDQLTVGI